MITGIILLGGNGTRLNPITEKINKHLLPVYNKPMWHYPLSLMISIGIRKVGLIVNEHEYDIYSSLVFPFLEHGIQIEVIAQREALGIVDGINVAHQSLQDSRYIACLGDNIFLDKNISNIVKSTLGNNKSVIFTKRVNEPSSFGVVVRNANDQVEQLIEKPKDLVSREAIVGLYALGREAIEDSQNLQLSNRGEFEIVDLLQMELAKNNLFTCKLNDTTGWYDLGTVDDLIDASHQVREIETNGSVIGSPLVEMFKKKMIGPDQLQYLIKGYKGKISQTIRQETGL